MKYLVFLSLFLGLGLFAIPSVQAQTYFPTVSNWNITKNTDAQCAGLIPTQSQEPLPENTIANNTIPTAGQLASFYAAPLNFVNGPQIIDFKNVTGNYTGTTDMIMRWAACKWGIDENIVRADAWYASVMVQNSFSLLSTIQANCSAGGWNGWDPIQNYCYTAYGITQEKVLSFNTWPMSLTSTSFNEDFRWAYWRACMNGDITYFGSQVPVSPNLPYPNTNLNSMVWGCVASWYSGDWYSAAAIDKINQIQANLSSQPWLTSLPIPAGLIITAPTSGTTVSGNAVNVAIGFTPNDPKICFSCLNTDNIHRTCTPSVGPWTWDTTSQVMNGSHYISADSYTCDGLTHNYHASTQVNVNNTTIPLVTFTTLGPNAALPTLATCSSDVNAHPSTELAPWNANDGNGYNSNVPPGSIGSYFYANAADPGMITSDFTKIDGNFTGSTESIFRYYACKYGVDTNLIRAQSWAEHGWHEDCAGLHPGGSGCNENGDFDAPFFGCTGSGLRQPTGLPVTSITPGGQFCQLEGLFTTSGNEWNSWSLLQTKVSFEWFTWPMIAVSTPFAVDYHYATFRACMNGNNGIVAYFNSQTAGSGTNYQTAVTAATNNPNGASSISGENNLQYLAAGCTEYHFTGGWGGLTNSWNPATNPNGYWATINNYMNASTKPWGVSNP